MTRRDNVYIENLQVEQIEIAGAPINIFPLMGIHNQGSTIDLVGSGYPLSSGTPSGYNALDAFNSNLLAWRSHVSGVNVLTQKAWIGYCFGTIKNASGTEKYASPVNIRNEVRTLKIKQSQTSSMRATQLRVEQSDDGVEWRRVDVINVSDDAQMNTYRIKQSPKAAYWRIVPTMFNGVDTNDPWEVVEIQLLEETQTSLDDIQDPLLLENRDRHYNKSSVRMKCYYDIMDISSDLSRFGIELPTQYVFTVSFLNMVNLLGRPIVVGDLIEMPTEMQYDKDLKGVKRWLEVSDATWATEGYTPNWQPTLYKFYASPVIPAAEHRDILGTSNAFYSESDDDFFEFNRPISTVSNVLTDVLKAEAEIAVPETGSSIDYEDAAFKNQTGGITEQASIYIEDGIPPNDAPYTEGPTYPSSPVDGDYHRLTYDGVGKKLPTRLYQWNAVKKQWIFLEQDNRTKPSSFKPSMNHLVKNGVAIDD
jgi:hypothetical protein